MPPIADSKGKMATMSVKMPPIADSKGKMTPVSVKTPQNADSKGKKAPVSVKTPVNTDKPRREQSTVCKSAPKAPIEHPAKRTDGGKSVSEGNCVPLQQTNTKTV